MSGWRRDSYLRYCSPTPKIILFGVILLLIAGLVKILEYILWNITKLLNRNVVIDFTNVIIIIMAIVCAVFIIAVLEFIFRGNARNIKYIVRKTLCASYYGNPLNLREAELEPRVEVSKTLIGYMIRVDCMSAKFSDVSSLETVISGCLRGKYGDYAVVYKEEDIAGRFCDYYIRNVIEDYNKQSVYKSVDDIPVHPTRIYIREDVYIDYASVLNASALIVGKTRSGKTTGTISTFLLPLLKQGRDDFGSKIVIIDPKSAELSLCPYVLSPAEDGSVEHILDAIREFNQTRIRRQKILNYYCKMNGKAVKWFDIGMKPCVLFIDEYISLLSMLPSKPSKEKPDYSVKEFQDILHQIFTQGSSCSCFCLISVSQASVTNGGISSIINNSVGVRCLFKPSVEEGRFLWDSSALEVMRERQYVAGDAWMSAEDINSSGIRLLKFPRIEFGEYEALSTLLEEYYSDTDKHEVPSEATKKFRRESSRANSAGACEARAPSTNEQGEDSQGSDECEAKERCAVSVSDDKKTL